MKLEVKKEVRYIIKVLDLNCSIDEFKHHILDNYENGFTYICMYFNRLSDDFIREFHDVIDWKSVCVYWGMSLDDDVIQEFKENINDSWFWIRELQKLSEKYIKGDVK